ncbi:acyltransferase [Chitinophaga sp. sic0106]|uniref:acyltransferase family protein n=1 Tax=Chitinophaga sp. sic0106 TaxID=2854785 RepID=UPI001C46EA17|nr:acyltransferase [Chitinophaga sp. sic0106]MBV7529615.1 acyltransferase [Chitinophaga sp. sic0106]
METGTMVAKPEAMQAKKHYEILDGLRGVAAVMVVIFHFMEVIFTDPTTNFVGHGFLAVDFFFCLSGFVIAYAYDNRMATMSTGRFFLQRLIRLHPLVVLGATMALVLYLLDPIVPPFATYGVGSVALIFLTSVLLIPYPVMEERYFNLFSLNAPSWSLFWEYVANIVYALVLWRLPRRVMVLLTLLAAGGISYVAFTAGNVVGGWSGGTFWHGFARVAYSFPAGILIYRYRLIIPNKLGFPGLTLLLLAALMMPYFQFNWAVELGIVLVYFPLLVALGAGAVLQPALKPLCVLSGNLSYPLYMTHYGAIWIFANYFNTYKPGTTELTMVVISGVLILIAVAYMAMRWFDVPVRQYLTKKLLKKQ